MSLFNLSTEEIQAEAVRLLAELAARRHAGDCETVHVRFVCATHVAHELAFSPCADRWIDQAAWERRALAHWLALVPDLEEVLVVVRSYGRPVRTVLLEPAATPARPGAASARAPSG